MRLKNAKQDKNTRKIEKNNTNNLLKPPLNSTFNIYNYI